MHACVQTDTHLRERHLPRQLYAHHDHACHPEEDYVMTCFQQAGGVERRQLLGLFRPVEHTEGEQARRKPAAVNKPSKLWRVRPCASDIRGYS